VVKRGITTVGTFLRRFKKALKDVDSGSFIPGGYDGVELRFGEMCPITFMEGAGRHSKEVDEAAQALGIPSKLQHLIVTATDYRLSDLTTASERQLRIKMLEAIGY